MYNLCSQHLQSLNSVQQMIDEKRNSQKKMDRYTNSLTVTVKATVADFIIVRDEN